MREVYLAFLGANDYDPAVYYLGDKTASITPYVQVAELEIYGKDYFDKIFIALTKTSKEKHFLNLKKELESLGINSIQPIIIPEELDPNSQWKGFENILANIEEDDELVVDLTHGFRIIPIIFSTAIYFLQKIKNVKLKAVYYGAYEENKNESPIVDVKDFYIVNEWADAVGRLVEDADASKLAKLSKKDSEISGIQISKLNNRGLLDSFEDLTNSIKGVELNQISSKANKIITNINQVYQDNNSLTTNILLSLIKDKFKSLTTDKLSKDNSNQYNKEYFEVQLNFIKLLLDHKLFMQCFTAMREFIVSLTDMEVKKQIKKLNETIWKDKGRKKHKKYLARSRKDFSDKIIGMLCTEKEKWNFKSPIDPEGEKSEAILYPVYDKFKEIGIEEKLRKLVPKLQEYRNGFDHGWTGNKKQCMPDDISNKAEEFYSKLKEINEIFFSSPT